MKYDLPDSQHEILPNLLGITSHEEIALSEFEGFLRAEIQLTESLTARTRFNTSYILKMHKLSLGHLYAFAGKYRDVNMSKGGFPFAASRFLPASMKSFEEEILNDLPNKYHGKNEIIRDIARVHGELLFIHPFREGNGRTARMLANLMSRKQGYEALHFELINENNFDHYLSAVQLSAKKEYTKNGRNYSVYLSRLSSTFFKVANAFSLEILIPSMRKEAIADCIICSLIVLLS